MNFRTLSLEKGQKIVVSTSAAEFTAKFKKISQNGARLDVVDVQDKDGTIIFAFKHFFKDEVVSVGLEKRREAPPPPSLTFQLTQSQLAVITNSIENLVYLQQPDSKYFEALEDISKRFVIGVSANCCRGRIDNTSLLAISTGDKIYIFDLLQLNAEKTIGELKEILDSDAHLKIVYDTRNIVDNFRFKLRVDLQPVFDVMLAAAQFFDSESVIGLENVVKSVLGVDVEVGEVEAFAARPLTREFLRKFAGDAAFLVAMYHKLASKGFSYAFAKHAADSDYKSKDFYVGLGLTDSEKLRLQLQSSQIKVVDFSIYE